jgi:hypothetical protein
MGKIAFAFQVFTLMIALPLYPIVVLNHTTVYSSVNNVAPSVSTNENYALENHDPAKGHKTTI